MNKEISKEEAIAELKRIQFRLGKQSTAQPALTLAIEALEQKPSGEGVKSAEEVLKEVMCNRPSGFHDEDSFKERMSEGYGEQIVEAMHEFHNQFQPPVISDEEIEKESLKYYHDYDPHIVTFKLGMQTMRKLLTNKEY